MGGRRRPICWSAMTNSFGCKHKRKVASTNRMTIRLNFSRFSCFSFRLAAPMHTRIANYVDYGAEITKKKKKIRTQLCKGVRQGVNYILRSNNLKHSKLTCPSLIALLLKRSQSVSVAFPLAACPASTEAPPFNTPPISADGHGPHRGCQTVSTSRNRVTRLVSV